MENFIGGTYRLIPGSNLAYEVIPVIERQGTFLSMSKASFLLLSLLIQLKITSRLEAIATCTPGSLFWIHEGR